MGQICFVEIELTMIFYSTFNALFVRLTSHTCMFNYFKSKRQMLQNKPIYQQIDYIDFTHIY